MRTLERNQRISRRTSLEVLTFVDDIIATKLERKRTAGRERKRQPKDRDSSRQGKVDRAAKSDRPF